MFVVPKLVFESSELRGGEVDIIVLVGARNVAELLSQPSQVYFGNVTGDITKEKEQQKEQLGIESPSMRGQKRKVALATCSTVVSFRRKC